MKKIQEDRFRHQSDVNNKANREKTQNVHFFHTFQQRKALHLSESSHRDQMRDPTLQPSTSPENYSHQKTNKLHFNRNHPIINNKTSKQTNKHSLESE